MKPVASLWLYQLLTPSIDAIFESYSEYFDLRPQVMTLPLYSLSRTVPATYRWVWSTSAWSASRSGANQKP